MEEKRRIITELIQKENKAKKNIEEYMKEQERMRLQFEENINKKSKKYFYNIFNIYIHS
jgi:vacuolar-type H+-ATPase subunit H